jgi:hypothetical protein
VVSDAVKNLKSYLITAITALTQQIAQNQAPQRLLLVPPEAVKESLLNESFGDILSTTAFPFSSSSPVGLGHAPLRLSLPGPVSNLTRRPHQA